VLSAPRPELRLAAGLSDAETAVLGRLIEGETLPEIARSRSTSPRTVANQLGAVFRKLGISGRGAALGKLAARTSVQAQPS
jgi:DNA-binding CsgD family transcriptional regulator